MKPRIIWIGVLVICMLAVDDAQCGTITGIVHVRKSKKAKPPARYHLGPYRSARRTEQQRSTGPQDVVVHLSRRGIVKKRSKGAVTVTMLQKNESFIPRVLPVLAGTTVEFPNEDDFYHNVFSLMSGDRFDLGRYAKGGSAKAVFDKPGVVVVRCEIHSSMKAYIVVLETPYFAVPDETGSFSLEDVPAGTYDLKAWHPSFGEEEQRVKVTEKGTVTVDLSF